MKRFFKSAVLAALLLPLFSHDPAAVAVEQGNGAATALIEEMMALDAAFREIVSAVALGNGKAVMESIETMHGKKEHTEEALHAGKITLPKNPDKLTLFRRLDSEFHADLRMLENAARKDDRDRMVEITQRLLGRCVTCHDTFRK